MTQGVEEAVAMTHQFEMISKDWLAVIAGPDLSTHASGRSRSTPSSTHGQLRKNILRIRDLCPKILIKPLRDALLLFLGSTEALHICRVIKTCPSFVRRDLLRPPPIERLRLVELLLHRMVFTLGIAVF